MDLNNYNNSLNVHGTLEVFSKHLHSYNLIWFFWQPCEVGWAGIASKFSRWANESIKELSNPKGWTGRSQSL